MFDQETARVISDAPPLPGLDPETLVDELTTAYVEIASARLKVGAGASVEDRAELLGLADRMGRLADVYETEIVLDVQAERRRSIAFVAGSARQVLAQIARLDPTVEKPTVLDQFAVGAEIAAALLFLIAERSSDAYEASRDIRATGETNAIRRVLILNLGRFARGQFQEIADTNLEAEVSPSTNPIELAVDLLYREILIGLMMLARAGLGLDGIEAIETAQTTFQNVINKSVATTVLESATAEFPLRATSIFAGPHHLAALLGKAAGSFRDNTLVLVPAPEGADTGKWTEWITSEASRWPFLWENHRQAIATGYLNQGASLVMTTPTGSGKSTLAALKIVSTLAAGKTVLYLAPTHALVSQIEDDLNKRVVGVAKAVSIENVSVDETVQALPDIAVVTPERCFALLTFAPELFVNVGLFVFDEFHLLGVNRPAFRGSAAKVDRRGIDAMLCLLTFQATNPGADYLLLSAMVSNGTEIAEWLGMQIGRPAIPFDFKWKPTRQLRSCVIYEKNELQSQVRKINIPPRSNSPAAVPYGMFSLSGGWDPKARDKILIRPFSAAPVALAVGGKTLRRWLTANRYEVASNLAGKFAASGLKVVVFCESIVTCGSVAKALNGAAQPFPSQRDAGQEKWRSDAISELGSSDAIYDAGTQMAAVHHGELLSCERRLVETLFKDRDSGVNVLSATSTLAQGLNLPCDVVILASSDRLDDADAEEKARVPLMPHEIINALGRAGRAGQAATGFSIVIPGSPLPCDLDTKSVSSDEELKVIFAEGDQCLPLDDPLTTLFDQIEVAGVVSQEADYLLRRLATSLGQEREGVETFDDLARRTFGFYRRHTSNPDAAEEWLVQRKAILLDKITQREEPPSLPWQEELAAKTGTTAAFIVRLAAAYEGAPFNSPDADVWVKWLIGQLNPAEQETDAFLRPEAVGRVFGRAYTTQPNPEAARRIALQGTLGALDLWFGGRPLCEIEKMIAAFVAANEIGAKRPTTADAKGKRARRLAIRLAPDLGFLCGLFSQISQKISEEQGTEAPPMAGFLSQLTRHGFKSPYHYALSRDSDSGSRVEVHQTFEGIAGKLHRDAKDNWDTVRQKLETVQITEMFGDLSHDDFQALLQQFQTNDGS
jgi:superfamily II DNA/RNA helicase